MKPRIHCAMLCLLLMPMVGLASGNPLRECNIRGDGGVIALSRKVGSQYKGFDSPEALRQAVTVVTPRGAPAEVTVDITADWEMFRQEVGRSADYVVAVDGGRYEGKDDSRRHQGWKFPVKAGWNTVNIRVEVSDKTTGSHASYSKSIKFFAYVYEVSRVGEFESPYSDYPAMRFVDDLIVDSKGNTYASVRCYKTPDGGGFEGHALLRYSPSGKILARYEMHRELGAVPMAVDVDGNLYAMVMENIVKFDPRGRFVCSVAVLGSLGAGAATADNLRTKKYPDGVYGDKDRRPEVWRGISLYASGRETAVVGNKIYFMCHDYRTGKQGPNQLLVCMTTKGTAEIIAEVSANSGPRLGPGGRLYVLGKPENGKGVLLSLALSGGGMQKKMLSESSYPFLSGFDGAGTLYTGDMAWDLQNDVRRSSDVGDERYRWRHEPGKQGVCIDKTTGAPVVSDHRHVLYSWLYKGSLYNIYEHDRSIACFTSLMPGATKSGFEGDWGKGDSSTRDDKKEERSGSSAGGSLSGSAQNGTGASDIDAGGEDGEDGQSEDADGSEGGNSIPPAGQAATTAMTGLLSAIAAWLVMKSNGVQWQDLFGAASSSGSDLPPIAVPQPPPLPGGGTVRPEDPETGKLVGDILEGQRRIDARSESIARREEEIRKLEEEILGAEQRLGLDPDASALEDKFVKHQGDLMQQGYRLINPGYDGGPVVGKAVDFFVYLADLTPVPGGFVPDLKPVRCEQFADLGAQGAREYVKDIFGERANEVVVDTVYVDAVRDSGFVGTMQKALDVWAPKNHVATRVILPDGRRFVLDYWEANRGGGITMIPEDKWVERWKGRVGEDLKCMGSGDYVQGMVQDDLSKGVEKIVKENGCSKEDAMDQYLKDSRKDIEKRPISPEEKNRRIKQLETLGKSYLRFGGFKSEGVI